MQISKPVVAISKSVDVRCDSASREEETSGFCGVNELNSDDSLSPKQENTSTATLSERMFITLHYHFGLEAAEWLMQNLKI